jgi:putative transposase
VLDAFDVERIRAYLQQQRAKGSPRFQAAIEVQLGRCATVRPTYRPSSKRDANKAL